MLQTVDNLWKDHLLSMDHLKEGIGLRGYAQQNPLIVYKKEGYDMFQEMIARVKEETLGMLFRIQMAEPEEMEGLRKSRRSKTCFISHGDEPRQRKNRSNGPKKRSDETRRVPAAAGKSIKNAAAGD